jgi:hypothetical protein
MVARAMREVGHVSSTSLTFFAKSIDRWDVLPTAAKLKGELDTPLADLRADSVPTDQCFEAYDEITFYRQVHIHGVLDL